MQTGEQVFPARLCRGCKARVVWAVMDPELKSGGPVAFDADPDAVKGNHILARDRTIPHEPGKPIPVHATRMRPGQIPGARAAGWPLYSAHSRWCPAAESMRKQAAAHHSKGVRR